MFHIYYNNDYSDPMSWAALCVGWRVELSYEVTTGDLLDFTQKSPESSVACAGVLCHELTYVELDKREQALGARGSRATLLLGEVPLLVYEEDTPRLLDDTALRRALKLLGALPEAYVAMLDDGFPGRWTLLDAAPHVWLHSEHASATTSFGQLGDPKSVDVVTSLGSPLDLSLDARRSLKKSFFRRSKEAEKTAKTGWLLDVSAFG